MRYFSPGTRYVSISNMVALDDYRAMEREAKRLKPIKGVKDGGNRLKYDVSDLLEDMINEKVREIRLKEIGVQNVQDH